jgi:inner membrane protein
VPSVFTHAAAAAALATAFHRRGDPLRFWLLGALCAVLPDLDVVGFWLGVPYAAPLGHRGLSHSLAFGALLGAALATLAFRAEPAPSRARIAAFLALATASHGLLDALTDGGLGIALFAPFSDARVFAPWRPLRVSPLEPASFLSARGLAVLRSELVFVWLPALGFAAAALALRRRRAGRAARALAAAALGAALLAPAAARAAGCDDAPYPLRQRDPLLQQRLERELRGAGMGEALDARRLTVSLVDLTHPRDLHYAGLHDDHMLYAASLPKVAILLALFEQLERGVLDWNDAFRWKLSKMINISDNAEATWAAEQVGLPAIAAVLRDPRYCLYEDGVGGLWAGRGFARGGPACANRCATSRMRAPRARPRASS